MSAFREDVMTGAVRAIVPTRRVVSGLATGAIQLPTLERRCPFCPGHEVDTERTVAEEPISGPWQVRVVENRYPVVWPSAGTGADGRERALSGAHEVVVETPRHDLDLVDLSTGELRAVVRMFRRRVRALGREPGINHVAVFRNRGRRSGSSQPHPHSQIVATELVPPDIQNRVERARQFAEAHGGRSLLTHELERAQSERLIVDRGEALLICPYAPATPYEIWIAPREPAPSFAQCSDAALDEVSDALSDALRRLGRAAGGVAYNLVVRDMPYATSGPVPGGYWFLDLLPRLAGQAGFELSTGVQIVTVTPEEAAAELRAAGP